MSSTVVVSQEYDTDVNKEYVIRGNAGLLKCQWPSYVADHLTVESWLIDDSEVVTASQFHYGRSITSHPRPSSSLAHPPPLDPDPTG